MKVIRFFNTSAEQLGIIQTLFKRKPPTKVENYEAVMSKIHLATGDSLPPLTPGKLRIYSMKYCPYAERTRLVLAAKNIPHETVNVNLAQKPDWLFEKNPAGKVPVIEKEEMILNESLVTSDYLDEAYPDNPLHPSDPYLKAKQRLVVEAFQQTTGSFLTLFRATPENVAQEANTYFTSLEKFEKILAESGKPYFRGDKAGMVDYMIFPWFERLPLLKEIHGSALTFPEDKLPTLAAWFRRMETDPAVIACSNQKSKSLNFLKAYVAGKVEYD
jgi:glutathione S-transferase